MVWPRVRWLAFVLAISGYANADGKQNMALVYSAASAQHGEHFFVSLQIGANKLRPDRADIEPFHLRTDDGHTIEVKPVVNGTEGLMGRVPDLSRPREVVLVLATPKGTRLDLAKTRAELNKRWPGRIAWPTNFEEHAAAQRQPQSSPPLSKATTYRARGWFRRLLGWRPSVVRRPPPPPTPPRRGPH